MAVVPTAFSVTFAAIDGLAIALCLFRIWFRLHIRRFWWEDVWAVVVFFCGTAFIITQILCYENVDHEKILVANWIVIITFTTTLWAVRMSLLCSIIRVVPPSSVVHKSMRVIAVVFLAFWTSLIIIKTVWCAENTQFRLIFGQIMLSCSPRPVIATMEITTDCISDAILVVLSLKLLWRVKLPPRQRRMILSLFSSSAIMSVFSLFDVVCQFGSCVNISFVAFDLEMTSALFVCNVLVVVTYMYRVILSSPDGSLPPETDSVPEDDDFTTRDPARRTTARFTTVDLSGIEATVTASNDYTTRILSSL